MARLTVILKTSVGKKALMALTGFLLSLFILVHLLGNSTILRGRKAFLAYATDLHSLGAWLAAAEILLALALLVHVILGILLYVQNRAARPRSYLVTADHGGRSLGSRTMIITGVIVFIFLAMHLNNLHAGAEHLTTADRLRGLFANPAQVLLYVLGSSSLALHVSHGFWSMFQSAGLELPGCQECLRKGAKVLAWIVAIGFGILPVLVLVRPTLLL